MAVQWRAGDQRLSGYLDTEGSFDNINDQIVRSAMKYSRRDALKASGLLAAGLVFAEPAKAAAPPPTAITPELIDAARREGKIALYSGLDLPLSEKLAKASRRHIRG